MVNKSKKTINNNLKAMKFTGMREPQNFCPTSDTWNGWKKRICIAVPTTGLLRIEWMMARMGQVIPCNWSNGDIFQFYDQFSPIGWAVADARNICVQYFLEQNFEWLLFIDEDVILPQDTFLKINNYMREGDIPIVGGLYRCKGSHPEPLIFRGRGNSYYNKWNIGDKVWCDGLPMGITLIHSSIIRAVYNISEQYTCPTLNGIITVRRVFETPRKAWFDPELGRYQAQVGTEDLTFFDRLKKEKIYEKCGIEKFKKYQNKKYPLLCDTSINCKHIDINGKMY